MKLAASIVGVVFVLFLAAASNVLAALPPRATGDGTAPAGVKIRWFDFDARDGDAVGLTDSGVGHYEDDAERWAVADFTCVNVAGKYAYFAGPIIDTNYAKWEGKWGFGAVYDGGKPGPGVDQGWANVTSQSKAEDMCKKGYSRKWFTITDGEITVHP